MFEFKFEKFDKNTDIYNLADFTFRTLKNNGILEDNQTIDTIREELEKLMHDLDFYILYTYIGDKLVGYLLQALISHTEILIWDWQPVILENTNIDMVASEIIRKSLVYSKQEGIKRIEVCFPIMKDQDRQRYLKFVSWYESSGFHHVHEEAEMKLSLSSKKFDFIPFPKNIEIKSIKDVSIKDLSNSYYNIFNDSKDAMFLEMNETQKRTAAKNMFFSSKNYNKDTSVILTEGNRVVGFSMTKSSTFASKEITLSPFGIAPHLRNKGLGKSMLFFCLNKLIENHFSTINLDVSVENQPAYKLYLKAGFQKIYSTFILAYDSE